MKKRLFATMLLFTCILSLTSCSKDDGDWDAMKWEKNNYEEALTPSFGKAIGVPKLGGTYTFKCKNYKIFWIEYVNEQVRDSRCTLPSSFGVNHKSTPLLIAKPVTIPC